LDGRPEGKRPLGRSRHKWEDKIKMDLREIGIDGANWLWLAQDRVQWWAFVSILNAPPIILLHLIILIILGEEYTL